MLETNSSIILQINNRKKRLRLCLSCSFFKQILLYVWLTRVLYCVINTLYGNVLWVHGFEWYFFLIEVFCVYEYVRSFAFYNILCVVVDKRDKKNYIFFVFEYYFVWLKSEFLLISFYYILREQKKIEFTFFLDFQFALTNFAKTFDSIIPNDFKYFKITTNLT